MIQALLRRAGGLAYELTIGLVRQYKRTSLDLAKIEVATAYVKAVKLVRRECMTSTLIVFGAIVFANIMSVFQMAVLLYAPYPAAGRIAAALGFGLVGFGITLFVVLRFFSEQRWLEMTHANDFIQKAVGASRNGDGS